MRQTQSVLPSMSDILCIFSFTLTPVDPYSSPSPRVNRGAHILHKREWRHREVKGITQQTARPGAGKCRPRAQIYILFLALSPG